MPSRWNMHWTSCRLAARRAMRRRTASSASTSKRIWNNSKPTTNWPASRAAVPTTFLPNDTRRLHHARTTAPTSAFATASILTAAANMAAPTAMPGPGHEYSRAERRPRFRDQDPRQARRAAAAARGAGAAVAGSGETISISGVTDCYQPAERQFRLTRGCLEVLLEARQAVRHHHQKRPACCATCDLLAPLAEKQPGPRVPERHHARRETWPARSSRARPRPRPSCARSAGLADAGRAGRRDGRADHSGPDRQRDAGHPGGAREAGAKRPATCCCGCRWRCGRSSSIGSRATCRSRPSASKR